MTSPRRRKRRSPRCTPPCAARTTEGAVPVELRAFYGSQVIRFSQLTLMRGAKVLIEGADATLNPGDRIGLIGANGSGKSSLFALLRGELHADKGDADFPAHWRVAHVAQETPALERPAVEYAIDGDATLRGLEEKLFQAEKENNGVRMG